MTIVRKFIILTLSPCFFPHAYASQSMVEAEQVRLADEMFRLSQREAWRGVEQMYLQLQALEQTGEG